MTDHAVAQPFRRLAEELRDVLASECDDGRRERGFDLADAIDVLGGGEPAPHGRCPACGRPFTQRSCDVTKFCIYDCGPCGGGPRQDASDRTIPLPFPPEAT